MWRRNVEGGNIPTGRTTFDKSQRPFVFFNSSTTGLGKSCLGISPAIDSVTVVGAANSVAGARAKTNERVFAKIIVEVGVVVCVCVCKETDDEIVRRDVVWCSADEQISFVYYIPPNNCSRSMVEC